MQMRWRALPASSPDTATAAVPLDPQQQQQQSVQTATGTLAASPSPWLCFGLALALSLTLGLLGTGLLASDQLATRARWDLIQTMRGHAALFQTDHAKSTPEASGLGNQKLNDEVDFDGTLNAAKLNTKAELGTLALLPLNLQDKLDIPLSKEGEIGKQPNLEQSSKTAMPNYPIKVEIPPGTRIGGPHFPPPPGSTTPFTVFTSTMTLLFKESIVLRTWIESGAQCVIYFVDDLERSRITMQQYSTLTNWSRVVLLENPYPRSPQSGKSRIDLLLAQAEKVAPTDWLVLVNSDIVLGPRVGLIPLIINETHVATSVRINCHVQGHDAMFKINSVVSLVQNSMGPCHPYNLGAMDFFMFRKGFWGEVLLDHGFPLGNVTHPYPMLNFYLGAQNWDNSFMHISRHRACDVSPVFVVGHLAFWVSKEIAGESLSSPLKGWDRQIGLDSADFKKNYTILPDAIHNGIVRCALNRKKPARNCFIKGSVRYATYQLCPWGLESQPVDRFVYDKGFGDYQAFAQTHKIEQMEVLNYIESGRLAQGFHCPNGSLIWSPALKSAWGK